MVASIQSFLQISSDALLVTDIQGKIQSVNDAFLQLMGDESAAQWEGQPLLEMIDSVDFLWDDFIRTSPSEKASLALKRVLLHVSAILDQENNMVLVKCEKNKEDIEVPEHLEKGIDRLVEMLDAREKKYEGNLTDIQRVLNNTFERIDRYKLISHNVTDVVCLHDPVTAQYLYVSPSLEESSGYAPEEYIGKTPYEFFHPDDLSKLAPDHRNKQKGEDPQGKMEYRMKVKDRPNENGYRWMEAVSRPIMDDQGNVVMLISSSRDIHDQKMAQVEKQTFFDYYKILANKIPNGAVFLLDKDSNYLIAEGEELKRIGRKPEDYVGKHTEEVFDERGKQEVQPYFYRVLKGERVRFEFQNFGNHYQVLGEPYINEEGEVQCGIILLQNITDSKLFEEKLKQTVYELNFQKSALDISAYVSISDRDGIITYVNDRLCQISGYRHDELVGQSHSLFNSHYHPNSYWDEMYSRLRTGEVWHGEMKNRDKNGDSFWADTYIVPFKNAKGEITQYVSIRFDVTQRKLMEEDLKAKNFELDSFVYHTSHDLRAPLTSILGLVNIILMEEDKENIMDYTRMIQSSILRLDDFIKSILTYSQNSNSERKYIFINFHDIIDANLQELRYLKNFDKVDITVNLENDIPFYCDPIRLNIIFKNIISNSIKYAHHDRDYNFLKIKVKQTAEFAQILFEDNGQGINEEYQGRIFDMFYRANEASDGSGLGLYIVKQTMDRLGGIIRFQSVYNRGTTFTLEIPNKPPDVEPDYE
ncbi:MAG TPA: hypothetical protein DCE41_07815 [Cytophagales bacterium]|nr:hypothetical protein [Cytophagales bacterium]HAA19809.1 hypothetical protein [Cytophagales bacterium]HAP64237.1 hypothetical protein [Cytophagales bacterium]